MEPQCLVRKEESAVTAAIDMDDRKDGVHRAPHQAQVFNLNNKRVKSWQSGRTPVHGACRDLTR